MESYLSLLENKINAAKRWISYCKIINCYSFNYWISWYAVYKGFTGLTFTTQKKMLRCDGEKCKLLKEIKKKFHNLTSNYR
jgi:hypothetical protein